MSTCKWSTQNAGAGLQLLWPNTPGAAKIFSTKDLWMPVQTFPSISLSPLVHRLGSHGKKIYFRLGHRFWASLPKPAALSKCPSSSDNQLSNLNCWRWCDGPLEREVCASGGMRLWLSHELWGHERPLWTTVIIWDDYMRWSQWGKGCSRLLRVDPDPGTQPVLCVTGETQLIITCSPGHRAGPSPVPRDRLCNKTPGLPAVLCGVTWLWDELWKFPTASVVLFSTKKHS